MSIWRGKCSTCKSINNENSRYCTTCVSVLHGTSVPRVNKEQLNNGNEHCIYPWINNTSIANLTVADINPSFLKATGPSFKLNFTRLDYSSRSLLYFFFCCFVFYFLQLNMLIFF